MWQFFSAFERGCWCSFFRSSGETNIGFWSLLVVPKCLVDIRKRVHKKSEAPDAFSSWCSFGLNEVTFFSNSLFLSSNISCLINVCALKVPKRSYTVVIRHSLNSRSRKECKERIWKMKKGAIYGNLLESKFFSNFWVVRIPRQWSSCELDKKIVEFQFWWKKNLEFCGQFVSAFERGCWCPFCRPSGERNIGFWWLLVVQKCLVDIWKRAHKNLRPLLRFHLGAFLARMRLIFFSNSLCLSSNFSCLINVFALKVPKRRYIVAIRQSLNGRSRKEGNERFWKMKNGARLGNLLESKFFQTLSGQDTKTMTFLAWF